MFESRIYVAPGKGQVTYEMRELIRHLVSQGLTSPSVIHSKLELAGHNVTYAAMYPYVRREVDSLKGRNMELTEGADTDLQFLCEDVSRYSIEVNYRTSKKEVLDAWAKLVLGFVSAALQREGYHVKHVYSEKPARILVSTNNWDDGAWTALLMYNHQHEYFVMSSGFWNKDRRTVSIQRDTGKCAEDTAAELVSKVINFMHDLKKRDPRKINKLKPAPMKRGPKR